MSAKIQSYWQKLTKYKIYLKTLKFWKQIRIYLPSYFYFIKYDENTVLYSLILNINIFVNTLSLVLVYEKICGNIIIPIVISTQITKKK